MSKEFQISDGNLIASFDLENEDGDIDFCKLLKVSHGVADEIGMFVDCVAINKIIKDQSKQIADLEAKLEESEKELNRYAELFGMKDKDFYVVEKTEYEKMKQGAKDIVMQLKQQLADYTKQVRKEVCNDFKSRFLATCQIEKGCDTASFSLEVLNKILDQLQEDKR